ncbi:PREDICTED: E3 ubiquitin-protein ligase HERC2-like [Priapulus caudatus]|uniref:E3 ubiquitin-protein ligase HERC2-like n=1 Tax=Priapulus caudatus TaxID=37621 RepID=A0ABM1F5U8_PRICU|nr:PREDICTED: E3 ubiquitin-protein ligase HERC2-like [Priapulus caudatus]
MKKPLACESLAEYGVEQICASETSFLLLCHTGKVYTVPYKTDTHSITVRAVEGLMDKHVEKVAAHYESKQFLALTSSGEVYGWGHPDPTMSKLMQVDPSQSEHPVLVAGLDGKVIVDIRQGASYSAVITAGGELYTWGRGNYGRLGHGTSEDEIVSLGGDGSEGHRCRCSVCTRMRTRWPSTDRVQCAVYSWGDGDYGKLGRGGSDGCKTPKLVDKLQGVDIIRAYCGPQFSIALSITGEIYTWGKGDNHRLGHGSEEHVRYPHVVEALSGKKVVYVSVGSMHCVAVINKGEVYSWGRNDQMQQGDDQLLWKPEPSLLYVSDGKQVTGAVCGQSQVRCLHTCLCSCRLCSQSQVRCPHTCLCSCRLCNQSQLSWLRCMK